MSTPNTGDASRTTAVASLVIPAYNEEQAIERCLRSLFDGLEVPLEVVVACNGCTDRTVDLARSTRLPITVLDLPPLGKQGALNHGERELTVLPRIFLDADIVLTGRAATAVVHALLGGAGAARPPITFDLTGASWGMHRFYGARSRMPNLDAELTGGGAYGLSAEARGRFDVFPELLGDDLFAASHVRRDEIVIVASDPLVVRPARTLRSLLKVMKRVSRGNRQLAEQYPGLATTTTGASIRSLVLQLKNPRYWPDVAVYGAVVTIARLLERLDKRGPTWERDDTTRMT